MYNCYICESELNEENSHVEHILSNALGGRLKSRNILCKPCAEMYLDKADTELARRYSPIATLVGVKRDRHKNRPIRDLTNKDGKEIYLDNELNPHFQTPKPPKVEVLPNGETRIELIARNEHELKQMVNGLKRKYPQLNYEDIINSSKIKYLSSHPGTVKGNLIIGGEDIHRSYAKSALEAVLQQGGRREDFKEIIAALQDPSFKFNRKISNIFLEEKDFGSFTHSIWAKSEPDKPLYVIVKYFSIFGIIVKLTDNYKGSPISINYEYDLILNNEVENLQTYSNLEEKFNEEINIELLNALMYRLNNKIHNLTRLRHSVQNELNIEDAFADLGANEGNKSRFENLIVFYGLNIL